MEGARFSLRRARLEGIARTPTRAGLVLIDTAGAVLEENSFPSPDFTAISLGGARQTRIAGNTIGSPDSEAPLSISLTNSDENVATGNRMYYADFVLRGSHNNQIVENDFRPGGAALYLGSAHNLIARNRVVRDPRLANVCWAFTSIGNQLPNWILDNYMEGFRYGIMTSYTSNAVIAGNRFLRMTEDNSQANIHLHHSRNIQVLNNEIADSKPGSCCSASRARRSAATG